MTRSFQAGDTSHFAVTVTPLPDPDPDRASQAVRGSWGRLEIWVSDLNLTQHRDPAGGQHDAVTWYLRPVLRWLLGLKASIVLDLEPPLPIRVDRGVDYLAPGPAPEWMPDSEAQRWNERLWHWSKSHALSSVRRGGIFPQIVFRRSADDIEISWDAELAPSRAGNRFVEQRGVARLDLLPFMTVLAELHDLCRGRIEDVEPASQETGQGAFLQRLRQELRSRNRTSWLFDPNQMLGPLGLIAQGLDPSLESSEAPALVDLAESVPVRGGLPAIDRSVGEPWQEGYAAALELRSRLQLDGAPLPEAVSVMDDLGVEVREMQFSDPAVRCLAMSGNDLETGPVDAWNRACSYNRFEVARRASIMQGLAHLVLDRTPSGRVGFPHGSDWTSKRSFARANAFAAMMLVPPGALRGLEATPDSLRELSQRLSTSPRLLAQHAANLGYLSHGETEALLEAEPGL